MKRYKSFENKKSFVTIQKIGVENSKSDLGYILSSVGNSAQKSLDGMLTHSLYGDIFLKIIRLQNIATISSIFTKEQKISFVLAT